MLFDEMDLQENRGAQGQSTFQTVGFAVWWSPTQDFALTEERLRNLARPAAGPGATMQTAPYCQAGSGYSLLS